MSIYIVKQSLQGSLLSLEEALNASYGTGVLNSDTEIKGSGNALVVFGNENFSTAKDLKSQNGAIAVFGVREYPDDMNFKEAIDQSYSDLLENRFALSVGTIGDKGFILTGERGIALAINPDELSDKFLSLFRSRHGQDHNKTILQKVEAFPDAISEDCKGMYQWMQAWEKLALFPSYQNEDGSAVYPGAEFGFVAKRTDAGTLVTARASNKTAPSDKDITLITDVTEDGAVHVSSLERKASLNGPLAHLIFQQRPEVQYIVHSHIILPDGETTPEPSAPGTQADWDAIKDVVQSGETIINQPYHGSIILLEKPEDLLPLLKNQSLYRQQSNLYDLAYARFQSSEVRLTSLERFIAELDLPQDIHVLDMCCGTGASTAALKKLDFNNIDIADGSASMLAVAEKRHETKGRVVKLEELDALEGEDYDLVTIRQAFNYVSKEDLKLVFSKASKIIAPGGHFVFNSFKPLPEGTDRRQNISEQDGIIAQTSEVNDVVGDVVRHSQRTEIIDTNSGEWTPVHDINEFYQHDPDEVVQALRESGFEAEAHITGKSVCYHASKPSTPSNG